MTWHGITKTNTFSTHQFDAMEYGTDSKISDKVCSLVILEEILDINIMALLYTFFYYNNIELLTVEHCCWWCQITSLQMGGIRLAGY